MTGIIDTIVGWFDGNIDIVFYILFGVTCAVAVFGFIMMIIKKRTLFVGISLALTGLINYYIFNLLALRINPLSEITYNGGLFLLILAGLLALIIGAVGMILSRSRRKGKKSDKVSDTDASPMVYESGETNMMDDASYSAVPTTIVDTSAAPTGSYSVDAIISQIDEICKNPYPSSEELRVIASNLQAERAKPENKRNPVIYGKLNNSLVKLLNKIQSR